MYWASMHGSTSDISQIWVSIPQFIISIAMQRQGLRRIFQQESRREESLKIDNSGTVRCQSLSQGYDGCLVISLRMFCQISVDHWRLWWWWWWGPARLSDLSLSHNVLTLTDWIWPAAGDDVTLALLCPAWQNYRADLFKSLFSEKYLFK